MRIDFLKKHLISMSVLAAVLIGIIGFTVWEVIGLLTGLIHFTAGDLWSITVVGGLVGVFFIYPIILTLLNLIFLFWQKADESWTRKGKHIEYITIVLGCIYSVFVHGLFAIQYNADWQETLINEQVHTPIWTEGYVTVIVLSVIGVIGYLFLTNVSVVKVPPLVTVLAMAAMYLGILECALWSMQVLKESYIWLSLFPFNCIVLATKTICHLLHQWQEAQEKEIKTFGNPFLDRINQKLMDCRTWPIVAFILMWPLLGIFIGILVLFGQRPDAVIKAWTETSDWNLSQRVAPQNIYYDEHYLCTVAAGGHESVVKPIRLGERHGHQVIVNRQLCVANAFEQILEEKMPNFHRHVRHFYDTYGFPISKLIHSRYIADAIYFIMKPLEWIFLVVLYLTDVNPENRIAMQYMPPKEMAVIREKLREKKPHVGRM